MSTFAVCFNRICEMDFLPKDPAILVSSVFGTEPKDIKNYLYGHGFVYSDKQKQFRPIGYDKNK